MNISEKKKTLDVFLKKYQEDIQMLKLSGI